MAWKKIVVSGSAAELSNINVANAVTASAFVGDGSGLTGVTAAGTLSSSAQIASDISGSFGAPSASFSTRITTNETDISDLQTFSASLDSTFSTDAELNASSSTLQTNIDGVQTNLDTASGSLATRLATIEADNATQTELDAVSSSIAAEIAGLDGDFATDAALNASSSAIITQLTTTSQTFSGSFSGSYVGDGSQLTNITVDQNALVSQTFTNVTTASVAHNFGNKNVMVTVYDENDEQFIPATVRLIDDNNVDIYMDPAQTGFVHVVRGGHIVSGSIPYTNLTAVPADIVSSSAQTIANLPANTVSSSAQTIANLPAGTLSGSAQIQDLGFASDAELNASSSTLQTNIDGVQTNLDTASGSLATRITTIEDDNATQTELDAVSASLAAEIAGLDGDFATDAELNASSSAITTAYTTADTTISASFATTIDNLSSTLAISGSTGNDGVNLVNDALTFAGTTNEIETTVTNNTVTIGIVTNPTLSGDVTITGDLNVTGDTISANVANLDVEDRFILLNSGSTTGDTGIIFGGSDGTANEGSGIFWDAPANVFGFAGGIASTDTTATNDSKIGNIESAAAVPSTAPTFQGTGTIHINTNDEGIWIYS